MLTMFILVGALTGVPPSLLSSLCLEESGLRPNSLHLHDGHSTSFGLCQIKLSTAHELGFKGPDAELMIPAVNALYAALYLMAQKRRYGTWERALSAYNAGHPIRRNSPYVRRIIRKADYDQSTNEAITAGVFQMLENSGIENVCHI